MSAEHGCNISITLPCLGIEGRGTAGMAAENLLAYSTSDLIRIGLNHATMRDTVCTLRVADRLHTHTLADRLRPNTCIVVSYTPLRNLVREVQAFGWPCTLHYFYFSAHA